MHLFYQSLDTLLHIFWMQNGFKKQIIKQWPRLYRVKYVVCLVDAKFFENKFKFCLQYLAHSVFYGIFECEIEGADWVCLPDAVDATNTLFKTHRVPRNII